MNCDHVGTFIATTKQGEHIVCTCSKCGKVVNKDVHEWTATNKIMKDYNPNRIWVTSAKKPVPFEDLPFIHLQNICKKIKQTIVDPTSADSKAFLRKNSIDTIKEMLKFLEEKKMLHTDKTKV